MIYAKVDFLSPETIENEVNKLLVQANKFGIYDFFSPTPMDLIAEKVCGLPIIFEKNLKKDTGGAWGALDIESGIIWIDNSLNDVETGRFGDEARCNFTIGHEIGHHILNHAKYANDNNIVAFHKETNRLIKKQAKMLETQANMFSAMLLMPKKLVYHKYNEDFRWIKDREEKIAKLMDFFRSSKETTEYRLKTLGL